MKTRKEETTLENIAKARSARKKDDTGKLVNVGRAKNSRNFFGVELKEMTMEALYELGGIDYLIEVGKKNPRDFLAFISRFIPTKQEITGQDGEGQVIKVCFTDETETEKDALINEAAKSYINTLENNNANKELEDGDIS